MELLFNLQRKLARAKKLKDELAQVKAEKARAEEAVIRYASKLLAVRRILDEVTTGWPEK